MDSNDIWWLSEVYIRIKKFISFFRFEPMTPRTWSEHYNTTVLSSRIEHLFIQLLTLYFVSEDKNVSTIRIGLSIAAALLITFLCSLGTHFIQCWFKSRFLIFGSPKGHHDHVLPIVVLFTLYKVFTLRLSYRASLRVTIKITS